MLVVAGCSSTESLEPFTPEPIPSREPSEEEPGLAARDAFIQRIAAPDVTFRVETELTAGIPNGDGYPAFRLLGRHDVAGIDYAGGMQVAGHVLDRAVDFRIFVDGSTTYLFDALLPVADWVEIDTPTDPYRPNAIRDLEADDLRFVGITSDGLFEFEVVPWILGDPIGSIGELGVVEDRDLVATTVTSHRTRLLIDADGTPIQLRGEWTFAGDGDLSAGGRVTQTFSAVGLYVAMDPSAPDDPTLHTSHDVITGANAEHEAMTQPWVDVAPALGAATAELEVFVGGSAMLGIEGAILFVRAHDAQGGLVLDQIVGFDRTVLSAPVASRTLVAYYRTCDGSCGLLDPPHTFCTAEMTFEEGERYVMAVSIEVTDGECTVRPDR
ncbi:MAG TPA: hypothetical protein VHR55_03435 [Candidatus Limnocylindria bacterium]|nr:hypothetical protein [Candidatus Limnocylindria bacterium]